MPLLQRLKSRPSLETIAALLAIGFGLALRLRQYSLNISFWLDEAMLALNIVNRSFGQLVKPLDYDQGAPLGFLWAVKFVETVLGNNEYSLRLLPFLAGCLSLFVLWALTRQLIPPVGGFFTLLVFASSRYLVSYGVQVKQYAVDVAVTLLLYLLGMYLLRKKITAKDFWLLGILGALAIWLSHAAVFTLGGLGLVLIATEFMKKEQRLALGYFLVSFFWLFNFAILYLIQYRSLGSNSFLTGFWVEYFMPLTSEAPAWTLDRLAGLFYNPGGLSIGIPAWLILVLFLAGVVSLIKRERRWVWIFALSLVFTLVASSLGKYPFGGRMGMFILPGLLICFGEGIELLRRPFTSQPALGLVLVVLVTGLLTYDPLTFSVEMALKPKMVENIAPTMAYLKTNYRPGDMIYLYRTSIPAFRYYAPKYQLESAQVFNGSDYHQDRSAYQAEVKQLASNPAFDRTWFLFSHLTDYEYLQDRDAILDYASQIGQKKREYNDPGTAVNLYLFQLFR